LTSLPLNGILQNKEYVKGGYSFSVSEQKQDTIKKTNYMKYREELERQWELERLERQKKSLEQKTLQQPQKTPVKEEKKDSAIYHIIRKGDTYFNLADFYWGTSQEADEIEKLNPGINPDKLKIGQKIRVK